MYSVHCTRNDFDVVNNNRGKYVKCATIFVKLTNQFQYIWFERKRANRFIFIFRSSLRMAFCYLDAQTSTWTSLRFRFISFAAIHTFTMQYTMNKNVVVVVVMPSKCIEHVNQVLDNSSIYCCCSNGINVGSSLIYEWSTAYSVQQQQTQSSRSTDGTSQQLTANVPYDLWTWTVYIQKSE